MESGGNASLSGSTASYRARWVIPVAGPPVANGIVVVHGERIVGIHRLRRADTVDLGDVAIVPGLVNCHTHLEFSRLERPLEPMTPFTDWVRRVVEYRRSRSIPSPSPLEGEGSRRPDERELTATKDSSNRSESMTSPSPLAPLPPGERGDRNIGRERNTIAEAIRAGLEESLRSGVTLLGDIATSDWTWDDYHNGGPDCVVFQELLGLSPERLPAILNQAEQRILSRLATDGDPANGVDPSAPSAVRRVSADSPWPGLSPHAPYSIHPELFRRAIALAKSANVPVAMHLAETEAERELLADGTGEFRTLLEDFGIWNPQLFGGRSWSEFLEPLSELAHPLVIHGNHLDDDALRFLGQQPHMTLVYCPRTHAGFGHPPHPWQTLLKLGGSVALGTDSRASNPDLSLWAEMQFLATRFPDASRLDLLRLATLSGARALGRSHDHGSLEVGKLANFVVVGPVPEEGPRLHHELITADSRVAGIMCRGKWVRRVASSE